MHIVIHYRNFLVTEAPSCADKAGLLHVRGDFESLPAALWTEAERWVCIANARVRRGGACAIAGKKKRAMDEEYRA